MALTAIVFLSAITLWQSVLTTAPPGNPKGPKVCGPQLGCVEGIFLPGFQKDRYEGFFGIPYALPPLGEHRFNDPVMHPPLPGIYNATVAKSDCLQKNFLLEGAVIYGNEDCLYLNVYRPKGLSKHQKLPVMVFIHGGGFYAGTPSPILYGPQYFMDSEKVVLVTVAYRLGPFGFLSTGDASMSGNWGLKDQRLALRWVQRNIDAFGGNPRMVTLFGQSSGATSVDLHMISSSTTGLFHNAIGLSGSANINFLLTQNPLEVTRKVAEYCNITNAHNLNAAELARALRSADSMALLNSSIVFKTWKFLPASNFLPVIESSSINDAFLTEDPQVAFRRGNYKPLPWLVSLVPQEGAVSVLPLLENAEIKNDFNKKFDELLEMVLSWPKHFTKAKINQKMALIFRNYFQDQHQLNEATAQGFIDVMTDRVFYYPIWSLLRDHVNRPDCALSPIYLFVFNYRGPYSWAKEFAWGNPSRNYGVIHCDDLIYLFYGMVLFPEFSRNSTDADVVKAAVDNMVYFAEHGKPKNNDEWKPCTRRVTNGVCDYEEFKNANGSFSTSITNKFNNDRMLLWHDLLEE